MLTWLRQQIETRKALAESASPWPWSANAEHDEVLAADGERVADGFALSGNQLRNTVDHIVFNDPRQIIADCEADLAILDDHDGSHECASVEDNCMWILDGDCPTVRRIASRYRHRPGYLPEWAPEGATP
jgi:hypothetical protein